MRLHVARWIAGLLIVITAGAGRAAAQEADVSSSPFVRHDGSTFVLNAEPFRFVGSNMYNAAGDPSIFECGPWMGQPDAELDAWFAHARTDYGASVVRFWAFQSYTQGGTNWQAFDRVLRLAKQEGLLVVPVLENEWPECTQGGYKNAGWFAGGYLKPYGAYALSYRDYVGRVVQRYRDDPTVLGWSLMNEAESQTAAGVADASALYAFAADMSAYVKSLDANHLVTLGVIGGPQPGVDGANYARLHALSTIDFTEYHDYLANDQALPDALSQAIAAAGAIQKPIVVGEAGMTTCYSVRGSVAESAASRARRFQAKTSAFFGAGGAGYLIWSWSPSDDCSYNFSAGDPLNNVLASTAASLTTTPP